MKHIEAEQYAEAVLFARKAIKEGVEAERAKMVSRRREYLGTAVVGGETKDPTAKTVEKKFAPIHVIRCMQDGKTFLIYNPETWLQVFEKSFSSFRERYGEMPFKMIRQRYVNGWTTIRVAEANGVSRRAFNNQRDKFLAILLQHALQAGLMKID